MDRDRTGALQAQFKGLRRLYFCYLAAAVAALVLFFIDKRLTLLLLGVSLATHLMVVRPASKKYRRDCVYTCVQATLERYLEGAVHTPEPVLKPEDLRRAELVADNDAKGSILCKEGGRGQSRGWAVALGDVTFTHSFPMEGKTHHEFATGMWMTVDLDHDTGLDWRLLSKRVMMKASRDKFFREHTDLQVVRGAGPAWLGEDYLVVRRRDTAGTPGDAFFAQVRKLAEHTPGAVAVCVQGRRLHVFITNRIFGRKVSVREAPTQAMVAFDLLPELGYVLKLADTL